MVPQWLRSPRSNSTPRSPSHFYFSSFKDINTLLKEDPEPGSRKKPSIFHRVRLSTSVLRAWAAHRYAPPSITLPNADKLVVIYLTSLHVVRKTFEDCRAVRSILLGFGVPVDERDLSLDDNFRAELQGIVGRRDVALPMVFIGGKYVGGAEEVRELHESGELKKMIGELPPMAGESGCDWCGGLRFVVCGLCDGSHKIYMDKLGFRSCEACNFNGLVVCPSCSGTLRRHCHSYS